MAEKYRKLEELLKKYPILAECKKEIVEATELLINCFSGQGKLLVCGNGGSAADSDHIVCELMKEFCMRRKLPEGVKEKLRETGGEELSGKIRGALPAISLDAHTGLNTAMINDVGAEYMYAQQVYGYGRPGDVLIGISTSGKAVNVDNAVKTAKALGIGTILFTGKDGGRIKESADISIRLPDSETYRIQELTLPLYHALCLQLEDYFWGEPFSSDGL
ncbi:MAG: SIS domain-containing protein [Lachnospiraceae bacterium]|nr:SIS domain-containing protein [Lachnospiraceae bacterium]